MQRTTREHSLTFSIQDYLKQIYTLTEGGEPAGTNDLATRLHVSAASVTGMIQKLASARPALVIYRKHQGVKLTPAGRRAALEVIRHHRLLETWLVQALGYSWDEVHGEADRLEHAVSEDLERRISAALGNPARDPHGEPIPTAELIMPRDSSVALSQLKPGHEGIVRRVPANDASLLRHLRKIGLLIGARVRILRRSAYDGVVTLQVSGVKGAIAVGPAIVDRVYVESIKNAGSQKARH